MSTFIGITESWGKGPEYGQSTHGSHGHPDFTAWCGKPLVSGEYIDGDLSEQITCRACKRTLAYKDAVETLEFARALAASGINEAIADMAHEVTERLGPVAL